MYKIFNLILILLIYNTYLLAMEKKPYHHLPDGSFRNPEGSPKRDENIKWSYRIFNKEKTKNKSLSIVLELKFNMLWKILASKIKKSRTIIGKTLFRKF